MADDHENIRTALRSLLEKEDDMEVIAETDNVTGIIDLARKSQPDVIIMEVGMHGTNIDVIRIIAKTAKKARFICMSMYGTKTLIREVFKAGAMGYMVKHRAFEELVPAIRCVMAGNVWR